MLASTTDAAPMPLRSAPPPAAPPMRCAPDTAPPEPDRFPISVVCLAFTPAHHQGGVLGFVDLGLPGGLELRDLRLGWRNGALTLTGPRRAVLAGGDVARLPRGEMRTLYPIAIPDPEDQRAFAAAAVAAIRRAFPDALPPALMPPPQEAAQRPGADRRPHACPIPATPPCANVALATMES